MQNFRERDYHLHANVVIPMRDGIHLNASIYYPLRGDGPFPTVLTITPYTVDSLHEVGKYFARSGFIYAAVDVRGRGGSEGVFFPTTREADDGIDVLSWISKQPQSDGQVVMWGMSYSGRNQWVIASRSPPALKGIAPVATGFYGVDRGMRANIGFLQPLQWWHYVSNKASNKNVDADSEYWLGAFAELNRGEIPYRNFAQRLGQQNPMWEQNADHPVIDEFWHATTGDGSALSSDQMSAISIPVLAITGYYDASQAGLRTFLAHREAGLKKAGKASALEKQHFVIGPWDHPGTRAPKQITGGVDFGPESVLDLLDLHRRWYDWVLDRGPKPAFLKDKFSYYLAGDGRWVHAASLKDATASSRALFLGSNGNNANSLRSPGVLLAEAPADEPDVSYVYDPAWPARNEGIEGYDLVSQAYLTDPRSVARLEGEGLIFESDPFQEAINLVGRASARLHLSMNVLDTDIRVALYEVLPDGTQIFLTQDQMRARYRHGLESETLVTPNEVECYAFERFDFFARRIMVGSRLRLVISPLSLSLHQQRNHNSGKVVSDETSADNQIARVKLRMGTDLSRLILPIGTDTAR